MRRVNQKTTVNQKSAVTYSLESKEQTRHSENIEILSPILPVIEKPLQSSINSPNQSEFLQKLPVKLMHNQADSHFLERKINQIIVRNSDAETMLQQISQAWGEAFAVDCCLITIVEARQPNQTGYWCEEEFFSATALQQLQLTELVSLLPNQSELLAISDVQTTKTKDLAQWQDLPVPGRAVLSIPTYFQGKQNGLITLWRLHPYQWRDSERECAQIAAESVAIALAQIAQAKSITSLKQFANTSTQYQKALNQLTMASRSTLDLTQILQLAISETSQALQVERSLIITLKYNALLFKNLPKQSIPKAKVTIISEWSSNCNLSTTNNNNFSTQPSDISVTCDKSFWLRECFLCQQAFINAPKPFISNFADDINTINHDSEINPLFNITQLPSLLMFPLEHQGTILGFLLMQNSNSRTWQSEELALLELVSVQVSTAIMQNQTLRQVHNLVEERTAQLQCSLEVQSKLYEKTRQQIDQLKQTNKLQNDFIDTISHELRTPLTSMNLAIRMLRTPGVSLERQSKYLDILEQQCTQEINLITDLLSLQKLESNQTPLNLQNIKICSKLNKLVQTYTEAWLAKGLTMTVSLPKKPLFLQTDANSFDRILHELLTNAGKYADSDTNVILKATQQSEQIVISLTNVGASIAPEDATYIFDKFRRGHGVTDQAIKGTGLGLALVKSLVQHLNGTIEVASTPVEESSSSQVCFTLTLPQLPIPN